MIGTYRFYSDGEFIGESQNIITTIGREAILRYLSGDDPDFAEHMVFGIGEVPATVDDKYLEFEYHRDGIDIKDHDVIEDKVIVRGSIPDEMTFFVYEVGLLVDNEISDLETPSHLITVFDTQDEAGWSGYDVDEDNGRTGIDSFTVTAPAGDTATLVRENSFGDFSELTGDDEFVFAYNALDNAPDSIDIKFMVDENNYRVYSFPGGSGFNAERWKRSDFTQVGTAPWEAFERMEIDVNAQGGSSSTVLFEGLRMDARTSAEERLVSRSVLDTPIQKKGNSELQIEYIIDVAFPTS